MLSAPVWRETNFLAAFGELKRQGQANVAEVLTRVTGGRRLSFLRQRALEETVAAIGEEVHGQYLLTFTPSPATVETYRPLTVLLRSRKDLQVRARSGYWATPE